MTPDPRQTGSPSGSLSPGSSAAGTLYVVATPIGNLDDMVPRAVKTLQQVDLVAAEDTRHSKRLLEHFHISTPLLAYHDHNETRAAGRLVERLLGGESVALVADAGTPLVSDPGYRLVRRAREAGVPVVPIPGPCAAIAALSAAGLPSDRFTFEGFLPAKAGQRRKVLTALEDQPRTLIFYEAPHRLEACLADMETVWGPERELVLGRELTKTFETIVSGNLGDLRQWVREDANQRKGEIVLVVRGASKTETSSIDPEADRILKILVAQLPPKQAAAIAAEITGVNKKRLYQRTLELSS